MTFKKIHSSFLDYVLSYVRRAAAHLWHRKDRKIVIRSLIIGLICLIIAIGLVFIIGRLNSYDRSTFEVVIARYKEDVKWLLHEFPNDHVVIYNKGPDDLPPFPKHYRVFKLPNLGKDGHTHIYHILKHYHNLAETTLFLQGNPYDGWRMLPLWLYKYPKRAYMQIINSGSNPCKNVIAVCKDQSAFACNEEIKRFPHSVMKSVTNLEGLDFVQHGRKYFDSSLTPQKMLKVFHSMQFAVDKKIVLQKPRKYYEKIFSTLQEPNPIAGYYLEWGMDTVFDAKALVKDSD